MNKALGNAIAAVMVVLPVMMTAIYFTIQSSGESQMLSLLYNLFLGMAIVLAIILVGMMMRDADFSTY